MKIAIVGSGISGLGAAYLLRQQHDVMVFEKNDYVGGHSRTVDIKTNDGNIPVDTGFIVFNHRNYPHLTGLFDHLDVPVVKSDMSFGVSVNHGWLEYGTRKLHHLFAQKRNIFRPEFARMIRDIMVFNKQAMHYINADTSVSLGKCLDELGMGPWFKRYYLLAMGASIWSTPSQGMLEFPASTFIRFFHNHGLLTVNEQPQWYTVQGGSKEYVKRLTEALDDIHTSCAVSCVKRSQKGIDIIKSDGNIEHVDQVIFACHSDQALRMIDRPSKQHQEILGAIKYQNNTMFLHEDVSFMPKRKSAWSSWVYLSEEKEDRSHAVSLSYWMNNLQPLQTTKPIIVTLNPSKEPACELVHDHYVFEHPVFDAGAMNAQQRLDEIQGVDGMWFTGAWQRYGFHEDGLLSAVRVAKKLGGEVPWQQ